MSDDREQTSDEDVFPGEPLRDDDPSGRLPPALLKALEDPFDYALGLRDGHIINFYKAKLVSGGEWVYLTGDGERYESPTEMEEVEHRFPRGIDVRLSDIMWVADAPDGS